MVLYLKSALVILFFTFANADVSCKGCVNLDEYNFHKIVSRFKAVLVKFDMAYPYGDKHDIFTKFAEEIIDNKNIIVAEVGVKDYGEKDNEELAKKYGVNSKEQFPSLRLFTNGITNEAKNFPRDSTWDLDTIRKFVKKNTNIYIGLPGCLERMDHFAIDFIKAEDKAKKYNEIEKVAQSFLEKEKAVATTYLKYMKKIISDGVQFVTNETKRLTKLLKESKIKEDKKEDLSNRLNILRSFPVSENSKDEL